MLILAGLTSPKIPPIDAHIVSIDRPGMGLSTYYPTRRVLDWPSDVLALANHLSLPTFHVLAVSGGSPYALACAKAIPKTRLLNTAIVSGAYPLSLGTQGMLFGLRALLFAASWVPSLAGALLDWEIGRAARDPDPKVLDETFLKAMAGRPEKDVGCLKDVEYRRLMVESMREAFVQGGQGPSLDLNLVTEWGFELEEVDGKGLMLWQGRADVNTPCAMAEKAAALLKGCEFMVFEEETHISVPFNHGEEILKGLLEMKP